MSGRSLPLPNQPQNLKNPLKSGSSALKSESLSMEIDTDYNKQLLSSSTFTRSNYGSTFCLAPRLLQFERMHNGNGFRLRGKKNDDNSVSLTFRIADLCGRVKNTDFEFYLDVDTAISVASEMVEQLELAIHDVAFTADFIDYLITKLHPVQKPSDGTFTPYAELLESGFCKDPFGTKLSGTCSEFVTGINRSHQEDGTRSQYGSCHGDNPSNGFIQSNYNSSLSLDNLEDVESQASTVSELLEDSSVKNENFCEFSDVYDDGRSKPLSRNILFQELNEEWFPMNDDVTENLEPKLNNVSLSRNTSYCKMDPDAELKLELEAIEAQYHNLFQELSRMKDKAMAAAKRRWMTKKKPHFL